MSCLKIGTQYLSSEFLLPGNSEIIFSLFSLFTKSFGMAFSQIPLLAIPFAACLGVLGYKIPPKERIGN